MIYAGLVLAWFLGIVMVAGLWPRDRSLRADAAVIAPLGVIVGLGSTSLLFFAASLLSSRPALHSALIEIALVPVLVGLNRRRWRSERHPAAEVKRSWIEWVPTTVFVQIAVVSALVMWRSFRAEPFGGWDGWAIWNMHARFMLRAGTHWPELLTAPQLSWTHPDYPRLLPASVARIWAWAGREEPLGAALVSMLFASATVALLVAAVRRLRGGIGALLGGMVLLATPFFVTFAANEHADIPLASFFLAVAVMLVVADSSAQPRGGWMLAGLCAGFAAWTKNEGLLFVTVLAAAMGVHFWRRRSIRVTAPFFAALAIALLPVLYFKLRLAPTNDLMAPALGPRLQQLFDLHRHTTISSSLIRDLGRFGEWKVAPWFALVLPLLAWRSRHRLAPIEKLIPCVIGLMGAGYYGVYLLSPQRLDWHIDSSLVRLLLQLWPATIFVWCLVLPDYRAGPFVPAGWPRWMKPSLLMGINCVSAVAVLGALSLQRGVNEIAVRRIGFAELSATLGEGWFPLEKNRHDEWAWSSGRAKMTLAQSGWGEIRSVSFSFALSAASSRMVVIRSGARVLWQGAVGGERVPVVIADLTPAARGMVLEFTTDTVGVAESPAAGGRSLAFAIYNPRFE